LLGELPEQEQLALEQKYFGDDSVYERLLVIEDELAYDYVEDRLSPERRERFQRILGATERGRENVELARSLLAALRASHSATRSSRYWAVGAAAALVFAIPSAWLAVRVAELNRRIEQLQIDRAAAQNVIKTQPLEAAFLLTPGRTRAAGGIALLELIPQADALRLELVPPPGLERSGDCIVSIRSDDAEIWSQRASLSASSWVVHLPAKFFTRGDYEVGVRRLTTGEPAPNLATYSFRLLRN
jgi:hypothetical protein